MFKFIFDIVWGFVFITTMALPIPPNLLVNVNNLKITKKGVAWTFDEDWTSLNVALNHAKEVLTNTKTTSKHTCTSNV
jgi:hypothetical protein